MLVALCNQRVVGCNSGFVKKPVAAKQKVQIHVRLQNKTALIAFVDGGLTGTPLGAPIYRIA